MSDFPGTPRPRKALSIVATVMLLIGILAGVSVFMRSRDGSDVALIPTLHLPMMAIGVLGFALLVVSRRRKAPKALGAFEVPETTNWPSNF